MTNDPNNGRARPSEIDQIIDETEVSVERGQRFPQRSPWCPEHNPVGLESIVVHKLGGFKRQLQ